MRLLSVLLLALLTVLPAAAEETVVFTGCTRQAGDCRASKKELAEAEKAYRRAVKLRDANKDSEALEEFETAARLVPQNIEYLTAREVARQQLVYDHLQKGNGLLLEKRQVEALAEFRSALQLDPGNEFAQQRLNDAIGDATPAIPRSVQVIAAADEFQLQPKPGKQTFRYRGDPRGLWQTIARQFGVTVVFDEALPLRRARFEVDGIDFYQAAQLAGKVSKTFWAPVSETQFMVAAENAENHRRYDRMAMRTFYFPDAKAPTDVTDLMAALRGVFGIRLLSAQPGQTAIVARAPKPLLDAATRFLENMAGGPPQVLLEIKAYQISRSLLRTLGMNLPLQFSMFHLSTEAQSLAATPGIQELINELIASGAINQANTTAISALLAQLQSQQASVFAQSFATFGGGLTLFGLTLPPLGANASFNESSVVSLQQMTLRAMQGKTATMRIGTRFPVINATFSPIFNTPDIASVIQNQSFQSAFPSFNYEDLGMTVKATPFVRSEEVVLNLETEIKSLLGQSFNGVPVISNRDFQGAISVKDGETVVVVGVLSKSEQRSLRGLPGLGQIPVVGRLFSTEQKQEEEAELLVTITPHVIVGPRERQREIWMGTAR